MPRTKLSSRADAGRILSGTIKKYLSITGKTAFQCSVDCGFGQTRLYSRLNSAGDMTLNELSRVRRDLSIPKDELWSVLNEML